MGRKTGVVEKDKSGQVLREVSIDPRTGAQKVHDHRTGKVTTMEGNTKRVETRDGMVRTITKDGDRTIIRETRNGRQYDYRTDRGRIGSRDYDYYRPSYRDNSTIFDNPWFWIWLNSRNNSSPGAQGYPGSYPGGYSSGYPSSYPSGSAGIPNSQYANGFAYDWKTLFTLPENMVTSRNYTNGVDWIVDYTIFEIISENTRPKKSGLARLFCWLPFTNCEKDDYKARDYSMAMDTRSTLSRDVATTIERVFRRQPVMITDIVDETTGELKVDEAGNKRARVLVVDDLSKMRKEDDSYCNLHVGDVVSLTKVDITAGYPKLKVIQASHEEDACKAGEDVTALEINEVQTMLNLEVQRVERGVNQAAKLVEQGKIKIEDLMGKKK